MESKILITELDKTIFLAGMAGGITTPDLVASVCNEGGFGQIGAGYMTPDALAKDIDQIRQMTTEPFGVNLFVPEYPAVDQEKVDFMNKILHPITEKLNSNQIQDVSIDVNFDDMLNVIIDKHVEYVSFTFGKPSEKLVRKLHGHHINVIGTATDLNEAQALESIGIDAIVIQGSEAGGHRGSFEQSLPENRLTTEQLFNQIYPLINVPLIVAGGITTPELAKNYIQKGASAVQLGTAFLTTHESGAPEVHKEAILKAHPDDIILTNTFSGRYANGIINRFIQYMEQFKDDICPYPIQNILTQPLRGQSKKLKNKDYMSLWCGTNPEGAKDESVRALMDRYHKAIKS
ncbi:NAD(P)H-dependent flavin oxidoreductase [Mammaliicoccus sciuri]|uniref:NAD(P)H-dependent flavin oxidoreductase n=1 Tax=Mammaliicoccus sciuri TaxID=1296 RepID=UPI003F564721